MSGPKVAAMNVRTPLCHGCLAATARVLAPHALR